MSEQRRNQGAGDGRRGRGGQGQRKGQGKGQGQRQGRGRPDDRRTRDDDPVSQLSGPLGKVLDRLPETQRRVLELRMGLVDGHPKSLSDTAEQLGMTMHEAKQVEQRAFEHIREAVPLDRLQKLLRN